MPRLAQATDERRPSETGTSHDPAHSFFPLALLAGAALLGVALLAWAGAQRWGSNPSAPGPGVAVVETRVPAEPVTALDRIYLSAKIANSGDRRVESLSVELVVVGPDGQVALRQRQAAIALAGHDSRAIYWAWRVPGDAVPGTYRARANVMAADGRVLAETDGPGTAFEVQSRSWSVGRAATGKLADGAPAPVSSAPAR